MSNQINISVLTDGKAGDRVQCLGVAEALSRDFSVFNHQVNIREVVVAPRAPFSWPWPVWMRFPLDPKDKTGVEGLSSYDIVIASGRRTAPYLRHLKSRVRNCLTVFLKTPPGGVAAADLIWVPTHDRLRGANVFSTETAPHQISSTLLTAKRDELGISTKRKLGIIIGGPSKNTRYSPENITHFLDSVSAASYQFDEMSVTLSRRTPEDWGARIAKSLDAEKTSIWKPTDAGPNPYIDILAHSSALVVTGDSHNMVGEALATGRDVFVAQPTHLSPKLERFLSGLFSQKLIRTLDELNDERLELTGIAPVDSTPIIAKWIRKEFFSRKE